MKKNSLFLWLFALLVVLPAVADDELAVRLYQTYCDQCHSLPLAPVIWGFPVELTEFKVRKSIGAMPRFPLSEISAKELALVADYVQKHPPETNARAPVPEGSN